MRLEDGRLYGPGTFDMKAGIAHGAAGGARVSPRPARRRHIGVVMLWTTDEEIGSTTSRAFIEAEARRSRAVLVLEPSLPGGAVKTARKGVGDFRVRATGIAAHAGVDPGRGASAIHELAWQVTRLIELADLGSRRRPSTSALIGGGSRSNVVAELAEAVIDVRIPTMADADRVTSAITQLVPRDARVRLRGHRRNRPPAARANVRRWRALFDARAAVAAEHGADPRRRRDRRWVGRKLHGRAWHPNIGRTRRGRRRRARAPRARAGRVARRSGPRSWPV